MDDERLRRFEAEELAAIAACPSDYGALAQLARDLNRDYSTVYGKREQLAVEREKRAACGAFLPDDGLPYCARMVLIHARAL